MNERKQQVRGFDTAAGQAMVLTVIGAGTILPMAGRSPSCHLLRSADTAYVFDLGPGSLMRLAAAGLDYRDLDTVFISHLHPDHTLDLVTLLQATNATPGWSRTRPLFLYGCRGLSAFVSQLLEIFRDAVPETYPLHIMECEVGVPLTIGDTTVETFLTGHTSNSLAFRVTAAGRIFTYSGDAAMVPALADAAKDAEIFLCEASFLDGVETEDHLTASQAAQIADVAGAKHLVLTHSYPMTDHEIALRQAHQLFRGRITFAIDGTEIQC
jgi:ribonuclease Z